MVIAPRAREASVQISLQFDRSRTVDSAAQEVQAAINGPVAPPSRLLSGSAASALPRLFCAPPVMRQRGGQARYFAALIQRGRFAIDSLLEQARFEPSVPLDSRRQNRECRLEYKVRNRDRVEQWRR
jgi:hypothetical protein